jgi:hypothetical protein
MSASLRVVWRRVRGLIGTAVTWAGVFALVGLGVGAGFWVTGQTLFDFGGAGWLWLWAQVGAVTGGISGAAFSLTVMAVERRGDFRIISPFRFGLLGAVAAGTVVAIMAAPESLTYGLIGAGMGFLCGSGSVVVARRALLPPAHDRDLLETAE